MAPTKRTEDRTGEVSENTSINKSLYKKVLMLLAALFFLLWIFIGIFVSLFIVQGVRQGLFPGLFSGSVQGASSNASAPPSDVSIPGVGKVNVDCVNKLNLSQDSLSKLSQPNGVNSMPAEDKVKFESCITQKESATPSASPS